ncbi:MAG: aminoacyl-tRNA hydrolase [Ruminococcaceae bacterium]|nr:aminoacyl-tRNA hydrolase [Oscillospiraceae bacterium]
MADIFDIFKRLEQNKAAASTQPITHLLVGLGNPGKQYALTRHNAGFLCMDTVCKKYGVSTDRSKFNALVGEATIAGARVLVMRPQTFMNCSGEAVAAAASFYKIEPAHIIVCSDDVSLDVGGMRVRGKGSDGGQKGLRSIIDELGTDAFPRIRFGVGKKPHPEYDMKDWVLSTFAPSELEKLRSLFPIACEGIERLIKGDLDGAMQICNRKG